MKEEPLLNTENKKTSSSVFLVDQKIINLTPIVSQLTTDIYEVSANGAGSYKETRQQMLTFFNANIQLPASQLTGAFTGYSGGNSALTGVNSALTFGSSLSNGNYLQFPHGNNIGQYNGTSPILFSTYNLAYDATAASYKYVNTGPSGFALELAPTGIFFKYAGGGSAGSTVIPSTGMVMDVSGIVNIQSLTPSQTVVTDSGNNLISLPYTSSNTANTLIERDSSGNFSASVVSTTGVNVSGLNASQAVVTDGSKNLASLAYASSNTASTLVERDSSGNFSASAITASLIGNASTATHATNATNADFVSATSVGTNAEYYLLYVSSYLNGYQNVVMNSAFHYNPGTGSLFVTGILVNGLSASSLVATDSSKNLTSSVSGLSPTFTGLNLSGLTASQAIVTDGSQNLISLAYTSSNTGSTLVARDSSGNFSAGTVTANIFVGTPTNDVYYYTTCGGL